MKISLNRFMNQYAVLFCGLFLLAGCVPPEVDASPIFLGPPVPPKASTLREIARAQPKTAQIISPIITRDGAYYVDEDGIFKMSLQGEKKLFLGWDQIPDFWKTWQEGSKDNNGSTRLPSLYKMADDSLLVGKIVQDRLNLLHLSKDGKALEHLVQKLPKPVSTCMELKGLDEGRVLASYCEAGANNDSVIIDLKQGTVRNLDSMAPNYQIDSLQVMEDRIFLIASIVSKYSEIQDSWAMTYDFNGKLMEKQNLSNVLGSNPSTLKFRSYDYFSVGFGKIAMWAKVAHTPDIYSYSCNFYVIDPARLSKSKPVLVLQSDPPGNTSGNSFIGLSCSRRGLTWLRERKVAQNNLLFVPDSKDITYGTMTDKGFVADDTLYQDWRFKRSALQRTSDGSLALLETPILPHGHVRFSLINPDARARLTSTLDIQSIQESTEPLIVTEPYLIIRSEKNEILFYKIEDIAN